MMTKRDYERAARLVRERPDEYRETLTDVFVAFFAPDNPRFDVERFRAACRPDPSTLDYNVTLP